MQEVELKRIDHLRRALWKSLKGSFFLAKMLQNIILQKEKRFK